MIAAFLADPSSADLFQDANSRFHSHLPRHSSSLIVTTVRHPRSTFHPVASFSYPYSPEKQAPYQESESNNTQWL